jgi:hypothetical protein
MRVPSLGDFIAAQSRRHLRAMAADDAIQYAERLYDEADEFMATGNLARANYLRKWADAAVIGV